MKPRTMALAAFVGALCTVLGCDGGHNSSSDLEKRLESTAPAAATVRVGALAIGIGAESIPADGSSSVLVRALALDLQGEPLEGAKVDFATSFGTFKESGAAAASRTTDANGIAEVRLVSTQSPALALVTASAGGFVRQSQVRFVPGAPDTAHSTMTANPKIILGDGASTTTVAVSLADANGLPVADGTAVTLVTTDGAVTSENPATTASGRAEFILRAPAHQGSAQLSVAEVPGLQASVSFGTLATGEPAGMHLTVSVPEIAVAGVGQVEETKFTIQVVDVSGDPLDESEYADPSVDNLRLRFAARPNGGEFITGVNAAGQIVLAQDRETIEVRTKGGRATLNLHSGLRPGPVELYAEFLLDSKGQPLAKPIAANLPLAAIASGPAHTIVLTAPVRDALAPEHGEYELHARAIVTDRYGNPVPDGSAIYLGLIDSVIAEGNASVAGKTITGSPGAFDKTVSRNDEPPRGLQPGDRALLFDAIASRDKSRYVGGAFPRQTGANTLDVQSPYSIGYGSATYLIGASLLGGYVRGTDRDGNRTSGVSTVKDGSAEVFMSYPANIRTLNVGCGDVPSLDTRHPPVNSARVFLVAESAGDPGPPDPIAALDRAVTVMPFCFAPMAGFTVRPFPSNLAGSGTVTVAVRDGGDVPLAFEPVVASVEIIKAPAGAPFTVTATGCRTDVSGACRSGVFVGGATVLGKYEAFIHYQAGDGEKTVGLAFVQEAPQGGSGGSTGEPAAIRLITGNQEISVAGVGRTEETKLTILVVDANGDPIGDAGYAASVNNLRVRLATSPNGGEYVTGANAAGQVVQVRADEVMEVRTRDGIAILTVHSGTRPGAVEVYAEFLLDSKGNPLAKPIAANLPLSAIAAGPPHSIALTRPVKDAIDPEAGVYRLRGTAIVNDRYGNPVPNGTAVYLGVIDTILAEGTAAANGTALAGSAGDFDLQVVRNDQPPRGIQAGDWVLLFDEIDAVDKGRHVATAPAAGASQLQVEAAYSQSYPQASYVVGRSLLGAHVLGTRERGDLDTTTLGLSLTKEGLADVIFDYPANVRTIHVGCGGVPFIDTRYPPFGSADVYLIAESAGEPGPPDPTRALDRAVTISDDFCFYAQAGYTLTAAPTALSGSGSVAIAVQDGGGVLVPFETVIGSVEVTAAPEGSSFFVSATSCVTGESGGCVSEVTVSGATAPGAYEAIIHYQAGDGETTVRVKLAR